MIDARAGLVLNFAEFTFHRAGPDGLDGADAHASPRIGSPGGSLYTLDSQGRYLVGLGGTFKDDLISFEAFVAERTSTE